MDEECLGGFLQRLDGLALPPQAHSSREGQDITADFADEACEGEFQHEEIGGLLVSPDLAQGDRTWFIAVGSAGGDRIAS